MSVLFAIEKLIKMGHIGPGFHIARIILTDLLGNNHSIMYFRRYGFKSHSWWKDRLYLDIGTIQGYLDIGDVAVRVLCLCVYVCNTSDWSK